MTKHGARGLMKAQHLNSLWILILWLSIHTFSFVQVGDSIAADVKNDSTIPKILIAYQSKYGSTKQYAQWIRESIHADLIDLEQDPKPKLADYDLIVFGGYLRTGKIAIAPFIQENWDILKARKIVLFTTSGTPPGHPKIQTVYEKSLDKPIRKEIKYFPLPGRISMNDLTFADKRLMSIGKLVEQDETLKNNMGKDFDGVKRENLLPLIEYLKAGTPDRVSP